MVSAPPVDGVRCDLPFRQLRPHGPPRGSAEHDQAGIRAAIASVRRRRQDACSWAVIPTEEGKRRCWPRKKPGLVDCLLLLSYPLHPPQKPSDSRTAHFSRLQIPSLFIHGTRDGFGSIEELTSALKLIPARTELLSVTGAGHELLSKKNHHELPGRILEAFRSFSGLIDG